MSAAVHQPSDIAETLLLAMLAVNSWTLDRVWRLREPLRDVGLTNPKTAVSLSHDEIVERLASGGHTRGEFLNSLMALRVMSFADVLASERGQALAEAVGAGRRDEANAILRSIKGVGPLVVWNFWALYRPEKAD